MKIEIIEEKENKLLDRKELLLKIAYDSITPRWSEVKDKLTEIVKADKDVVMLDSVQGKFGAREALASARVYKNKDQVLKVEDKRSIRKNLLPKEGEAVKEKKEEPKEKPAKGPHEKRSPEKPGSEAKPEKKAETKGG